MDRIWIYLAKRVISLGIVLVLIATMVFVQFFVRPGDPANAFIPRGDPFLGNLVSEDLKLNDPLIVQYVNFMTKVFTGKFFISAGVWKGANLAEGLYNALAITLIMFGLVLGSAGSLGGVLGLTTSRSREGRFISKAVRFVALATFVLPALVAAMIIWPRLPPVAHYEPMSSLVTALNNMGAMAAAFAVSWGMLVLMEKGKDRYHDSFGRVIDGRTPQGSGVAPLAASPSTKIFVGWTLFAVLICDAAFNSGGLGSSLFRAMMTRDLPLQMSLLVTIAATCAVANFVLDMVSPFGKWYASKMSRTSGIGPPARDGPEPRIEGGPPEAPALSIAGMKSIAGGFMRLPAGMAATMILIAFLAIALMAPFMATVDDVWNVREPNRIGDPDDYSDDWFNPHPPSLSKSPYTGFLHPFGTNHVGQDTYSLTILGTRGAFIVTAAIAASSILAGFLTWLVVLALKRTSKTLETVLGGPGSIVADAVLAIPILSVLFFVPTTEIQSGWSILYPAVMWSALFSFAMAMKSSRTLSILEAKADGSFVQTMSKAITHMLYAAKFVVVGCFLALFAFESLIDSSLYGIEVTWGQVISPAFSFTSFLTEGWWTYGFAALFTIVFLGCVYAVIDSLETIARRRWGTLCP